MGTLKVLAYTHILVLLEAKLIEHGYYWKPLVLILLLKPSCLEAQITSVFQTEKPEIYLKFVVFPVHAGTNNCGYVSPTPELCV